MKITLIQASYQLHLFPPTSQFLTKKMGFGTGFLQSQKNSKQKTRTKK